VPSATLQSVPWSILPSSADQPVAISPSASLWCLASSRSPYAGSAPVVVAAGPGLPGALREAESIAALYPGALSLLGVSATAEKLSAAMDGADLVHLAAHGSVRADNPLFSSVVMADGPFTIYDLERLRQAPRRVVLSACDTGRSYMIAGEELLGFTAALLAGGTQTLVAPVVPVPDAETAPLMQSYHRQLLSGRAPAEALARAQGEVRADDPVASAGAASFVCLGAGFDRSPASTDGPSR
jgi:CHAT domain-containing protein